MNRMRFEKDLQAARDAAIRAGELALIHRSKGLAPEDKADLSPVTIADRESERLLVTALTGVFPDDGILGEEGANHTGSSGRRWIIDPIDGTREFMRGSPAWCVLVGLEAEGEVELGVAHFPAMKTTFWAVRGEGAFRDGERISVSSISSADRAVLCLNGFNNLGKHAFQDRLLPFLSRYWSVRSLGGCLDAVMVAQGQADAWIEPSAQPWDLAALKVITEEAGARFFNFDGGSSIHAGNCVTCVPALEAELRAFVRNG